MKTLATMDDRGPPIGRPVGNLKIFPSKEQIFCFVHRRINFSNSSAGSKVMPDFTKSSYIASTATAAGMEVNILRISKETSLQTGVNRRFFKSLASWEEFFYGIK